MALPVSPYQPSVPIQYFNEDNVFSVLIDFHPSTQAHRKEIIIKTLNEIISRAQTNPVRMFCYNLVAQNNFQNEIVLDLIKFVNDYANLMFFKKKAHVITELIDTAAQEVPMFLTSLMMYRFPELKSIVAPQIVNAAEQNLEAFRIVLNELGSYYRNSVSYFQMFLGNFLQQGNQMSSAFPQNQQFVNQVVTDPNTGVQYIQQVPLQVMQNQVPPGYQVANPQAGMNYPNQSGYFQPRQNMQPVQFQQTPGYSAGSQAEAFSERFGRSNSDALAAVQNTNAVMGFFGAPEKEVADVAAVAPPKKKLTIKDWRSSLEEPYLILPNLYNQSYFFDLNEKGTVSQFIEQTDSSTEEEIEENIVDKAAHLKFFNKTEKVLQNQLKQDSELIFEITDKKLEAAKVSEDFSSISSYVYPSCYVASSLDELYSKALYEQEKQDTQVYRIFGIICEPLFFLTDFNEFVYDFYISFHKSSSLEKFAQEYRAMKEDKDYLRVSLSRYFSGIDKNVNRDAYSLGKLIDKMDLHLTEIFNDFISASMSLKIKIDSFFSDYEELKLYIQKKYPKIYFTELESFEEKIKKLLAPKMDENTLKDFIKSLDIDDETIKATIVSKTVSMTLIDARVSDIINPKHIDDLKESPMLILRKNNPKLYRIVSSSFEQAPAMLGKTEPIVNYLKIGIDPTIFKIYKGVIGTD
jgi:transcription antitermination factor NusG